jgi:NADH dehydrogenase FAD-containing subunit
MSSNGHTDPQNYGEGSTSRPQTKTVVILGAAYGGARAARMLAQTLPPDWRLVVIDRNSHMNRESSLYYQLMQTDLELMV